MRFFSFLNFPIRRYANGAEIKIEEKEPANTQIPIVKAKSFTAPVPNRYIAKITKNVENTVPKDLLMVSRRLASKTFP